MDNLTSIPATLGSTSTIIVGGTGQFEVLEALASFGVQGASLSRVKACGKALLRLRPWSR